MSKSADFKAFTPEIVAVAALKPHSRNYAKHPEDQLKHIVASIKANGYYRNIVVAKDNTILAGHGVWAAIKQLGWTEVPVIRLDIAPDSAKALRVLTGDNYISHLAETDDRLLSELLRETQKDIEGLLGTGFDEMMLANLIFATRPSSEIKTKEQAADWAGMPEYEETNLHTMVLHFRTKQDMQACIKLLKLKVDENAENHSHIWWPSPEDTRDVSSVRFETQAAAK